MGVSPRRHFDDIIFRFHTFSETFRPCLREPSPRQSVLALEFRTFDRSLLDSQLLAKSQIIDDQVASAESITQNYTGLTIYQAPMSLIFSWNSQETVPYFS